MKILKIIKINILIAIILIGLGVWNSLTVSNPNLKMFFAVASIFNFATMCGVYSGLKKNKA